MASILRTGKIKVLVVDDSLTFREVLAKGISSDPYIEVVAKAVDPFDARDKILKYKPDVMICDVEMPKMNGIEFIRKLLPQYPMPVIVVSSVCSFAFDAMNAGAVDFIAKPDISKRSGVEVFLTELISRIHIAQCAEIQHNNYLNMDRAVDTKKADSDKVIAIGASTGGTEAIQIILKALPTTIPGIVIVQHIPQLFSGMFAERLDKTTHFRVKEAETGDYVEPGKVLIAPGDKHMKIRRIGNRYKIECFTGDKVNGHRPSVDILFESVAQEAGEKAVGVILTGMGYDGAKGLLSMKRKGSRTIGQDEKTSVVYGMPRVAYDLGGVEKQAPIAKIADLITESI